MGHIHGESRDQLTLFADRLDSMVGPDHVARVIDAFVGHLPLASLGFRQAEPAGRGRPGYAPGDLLRLYLYGYLQGVCSSRRLERETQRNVEVMWLLHRLQPDFKTIARFRQENGLALQQVLAAFVQFCRRASLLQGAEVSLDGSKVAGQNARHRNFSQERLQRREERLRARIAHYLQELDRQDEQEASAPEAGEVQAAAAAALAVLQRRHAEVTGWLSQLQASGESQLSLTDAESRRMRTGMGDWVIGHNLQVAVDTETHLVVQVDIEPAGNDRQALVAMAEQTQAVLGGGPLRVLADGGYSNAAAVARCDEAGIEVIAPREHSVNRHGAGAYFDKRAFRYDPEADRYTCPAGEHLPFAGQSGPERSYRTRACRDCPLRARCTSSRYRTVTRQQNEAALEAMEARIKAQPQAMVRRKSTVEHVFGSLKYLLRGRFLTRSRLKVKTEAVLAAMGYNLRRIMNLKGAPWLLEQLA